MGNDLPADATDFSSLNSFKRSPNSKRLVHDTLVQSVFL